MRSCVVVESGGFRWFGQLRCLLAGLLFISRNSEAVKHNSRVGLWRRYNLWQFVACALHGRCELEKECSWHQNDCCFILFGDVRASNISNLPVAMDMPRQWLFLAAALAAGAAVAFGLQRMK